MNLAVLDLINEEDNMNLHHLLFSPVIYLCNLDVLILDFARPRVYVFKKLQEEAQNEGSTYYSYSQRTFYTEWGIKGTYTNYSTFHTI